MLKGHVSVKSEYCPDNYGKGALASFGEYSKLHNHPDK